MTWRPFGFDFKAEKVTVSGAGESPISWTARKDVGSFVAHLLTSLPLSDLKNRGFRVQGDSIVRIHKDVTIILLMPPVVYQWSYQGL
jgi:hypothetical protein